MKDGILEVNRGAKDGTSQNRAELLSGDLSGGLMRETGIVVSIVVESGDDLHMQAASDLLCELQISHEAIPLSNDTEENFVLEYARGAQIRGLKVIIASRKTTTNRLLEAITANTLLPVLEIPISIVHKDNALSVSAALTAAAILGLNDCWISERLRVWRDAHGKRSAQEQPQPGRSNSRTLGC